MEQNKELIGNKLLVTAVAVAQPHKKLNISNNL